MDAFIVSQKGESTPRFESRDNPPVGDDLSTDPSRSMPTISGSNPITSGSVPPARGSTTNAGSLITAAGCATSTTAASAPASGGTADRGQFPAVRRLATDGGAASLEEKARPEKHNAVSGHFHGNNIPSAPGAPSEQALCNYCFNEHISTVLNGRPDILSYHLFVFFHVPEAVKVSFGKGTKRRAYRSAVAKDASGLQ